MPIAVVLYIIGAVVAGIGFFAPTWRYGLHSAALAFVAAGLAVQASG